MRLAVVSDIHGNLAALLAVSHDIQVRQVDAIVNLGDSFSGPLQPLQTADYLMAQNWLHLAGNHERQLLDSSPDELGPSDVYARSKLGEEAFEWMAGLPSTLWFNDEVFLCHGTPRNDAEYFLHTVDGRRVRDATAQEMADRRGTIAAEVIVCGHTHLPRIVRSCTVQLLLNPGSVGLPAYEDHHPQYHVVESGSPEARYAVLERHN